MEFDSQAIQAWYQENRKRLFSRGLWMLGGEPNTMDPMEFSKSSLKVLIARLSGYHEVAQGITHSYLFQLAREVPETFIDFAFLPPAQDEEILRNAGIPLWTGTTTKRPPRDFDLIAISNSVVQELLNLPAMLYHSGIPLTAEERSRADAPLILLGGSNSYVSSILHGEAGKSFEGRGLVDGVLVGDAEGSFQQILRIMISEKKIPRRDLLEKLMKEVPGFYNPASYLQSFDSTGKLSEITSIGEAPLPVKANRARDGSLQMTFSGGPVPFDEEAAGRSHLLVSSGCPYFCSFCKESWEQKPYRERDSEILAETAIRLKTTLGLSEISIMSFNPNSLSYLAGLLAGIEPLFDRVSLKSQRFDAIVSSPEILEGQLEAGKRTFTCAMEGISQRLRIFLQKNLTTEVLLAGFDILFKRNIRQMKVFLIVTGLETKDDLAEFESLLSRIRKKLESLKGKPVITFSLAGLFRPPLTPLQFSRVETKIETFNGIYNNIIASVQKAGFEHRISAGPEDAVFSEFLAYADRRFTSILVEVSIKRDFRYRGQISADVCRFWQQSLKEKNLLKAFFAKPSGENQVFPWDDIDCGISKKFLLDNYANLVKGFEKPTCIGKPWGPGKCLGCGACNSPEEIKKMTSLSCQKHRVPTPAKKIFTTFRLRGIISPRLTYVGNNFLFAAFTRMLLSGIPRLQKDFLRFENALERHGSYGLFIADFYLNPGIPLPDSEEIKSANLFSRDLAIISISRVSKSIREQFPLLRRILHVENPPVDIDRKLDDMLNRYRIKHQKKWEPVRPENLSTASEKKPVEKTLLWEINPGHAKKCGFSSIRWKKAKAQLLIDIISEPEPHYFEKLGLDFVSEIADPSMEVKSGPAV